MQLLIPSPHPYLLQLTEGLIISLIRRVSRRETCSSVVQVSLVFLRPKSVLCSVVFVESIGGGVGPWLEGHAPVISGQTLCSCLHWSGASWSPA